MIEFTYLLLSPCVHRQREDSFATKPRWEHLNILFPLISIRTKTSPVTHDVLECMYWRTWMTRQNWSIKIDHIVCIFILISTSFFPPTTFISILNAPSPYIAMVKLRYISKALIKLPSTV